MITKYLSYPSHQRIEDVLIYFQLNGEQYSDYEIQYVYVISETDKLVGVLRLRDLLMMPKSWPIKDIMIKEALHVNVDASWRDLKDFFIQYRFLRSPGC